MSDLGFFDNKCILITGHTGFKGTWLSKILTTTKAKVVGYALAPTDEQPLFNKSGVADDMISVFGDIRDFDRLLSVFNEHKPDIVIHLAAQPIVIESYNNPRYTYETNVMGTVNVLECIRQTGCVKSFVNVTTDKVYENKEWEWGYRENERLCGYDPYSNSKSCSELVTKSYVDSFFFDGRTAVSTARAGNVIGGGDFAAKRIIPDCVRSALKREQITVRNPLSVRPYQHVLEPLFAYLLIARKQYGDIALAGNYNVGPDEKDCITTGTLADIFCKEWGDGQTWKCVSEQDAVHEANFLKLDCSHIKKILSWHPVWDVEKAVKMTVEFTKDGLYGKSADETMKRQITEYIKSQEG
ncbi:MAG: CDP-glucose 4,6-dehydratase [Clostridia bacterium]|nr:CDP-glucose 4,6-dehydratase [Clostridia bacterium]